MTHTAIGAIGDLRAALQGTVLTPGDPGFEEGRRVWNREVDRRPAAIARCASAADVATAIGYAREHDLEICVRGGAHNTSGTAVCDDGLMIDLSPLNAVTVDPRSRRVRAGGGALLSDLDAATLAHGLAVPAGLISHTGVGGLTLGGGMGLADAQVRAEHRQPGQCRDRHRCRAAADRLGAGESGPVLGRPRRRRQLRRRHLLRVRPARARTGGPGRAVLLAAGAGRRRAAAGP
jgi:hypothetical protein